MSDVVIRVENLGKKYQIGASETKRDNMREVIIDTITATFRRFRSSTGVDSGKEEVFWALKDVSFDVKRGDVVGIIGRNGAGKSTLLKILSKITEPTEGCVKIKGRVASLLEVGTGFHPELTGRENIYLNGAILGMSRVEINRKFDEIVAFSEIEKFLDTPVKRYSSGMYVRLAFAVAAHLEPEILIVDEVLAVGDAQFQKKCLGKMQDVGKEGRTVLFVSHNMGAVTSLCRSAIWLQNGYIVQNGSVRNVVDQYQTVSSLANQPIIEITNLHRVNDLGGTLKIERLEWLSGLPLQHGEAISARIHFHVINLVEDVSIGFGFSTLDGVRLLSLDTDFQDGYRPCISGDYSGHVDVTLAELILAPGLYSLDIGARSGDSFALDYLPGFTQVEITIGPKTPGCIVCKGSGVRIRSEWQWKLCR